MNDEDLVRERIAVGLRTVGAGFGLAGAVMWMTLFASGGAVEVATLAVSLGLLVWFATVDQARLVEEDGRLHALPFLLAALGAVLVLAAAAVVQTATLFLVAALAVAGPLVGIVRALPRDDDAAL